MVRKLAFVFALSVVSTGQQELFVARQLMRASGGSSPVQTHSFGEEQKKDFFAHSPG